jgi:hypothetical protein
LQCPIDINYESASFWISVAVAIIAVVSLVVSLVATRLAKASVVIANSSLAQAKEVADRDLRNWRQMKWFDLYFAVSEFSDNLENFQKQHSTRPLDPVEFGKDRNNLMFLFRRAASMAMVFPRDPAIDSLTACAKRFDDPTHLMSKDLLTVVEDAVEGLRQRALVQENVLG